MEQRNIYRDTIDVDTIDREALAIDKEWILNNSFLYGNTEMKTEDSDYRYLSCNEKHRIGTDRAQQREAQIVSREKEIE